MKCGYANGILCYSIYINAGVTRLASDPPKQQCGFSNAIVVTSAGVQLTGEDTMTMRRKCARHPMQASCSHSQRESVPIPRSTSYNGTKQACWAQSAQRHQSCSPSREMGNRQMCGQSPSASGKPPCSGGPKEDSCVPLVKMCAEMNMSGLISSPPPPPLPAEIVATQVAMDSAQTPTKRLLDDVKSHGQSKRQWNTADEIEDMIKSRKCSTTTGDKLNKTFTVNLAFQAQRDPSNSAPPPPPVHIKAPEVQKSQTPQPPNYQPTPPKRQDIPKRSLVESFIPKDQSKDAVGDMKKIDDSTFKPTADTSALEKGFNSVVAELKSITHNIFGKPEVEDEKEELTVACSNAAPVFSDSVKERIQKFQNIVNDANNNIPRPVASVRPSMAAPAQPNDEEEKDEPKNGSGPKPTPQATLPPPGIIRRVIGSIAQGGLQGLSTLHKEDDEATKAMKELTKKAVEHDKSELLNYVPLRKDSHSQLREATSQIRGLLPIPRASVPSILGRGTPRRTPLPQPGDIALPNIPIIVSSSADAESDEGVIDLTESLRGGKSSPLRSNISYDQQSSLMDSEVEYIPKPDPSLNIHMISSATMQGKSQRSATEDRFQNMIHTEPSIMRHEDYNKFVRHNNQQVASPKSGVHYSPYKSSRRSTIPFRANQYVNVNRGIGEDVKLMDLIGAAEPVQQDDGCVATSSASDLSDELVYQGGFVSASTGAKSPLQRGGRSILDVSARNSPKRLPVAHPDRYVDYVRGHDSGPSLPFTTVMGRDINYDDDDKSTSSSDTLRNSFDYIEDLCSTSDQNSGINANGRNNPRGGLLGGCEAEEYDDEVESSHLNYARMRNGSEESMPVANHYIVVPSESKASTPHSFQGPFHGTEFDADDSLRNLNQHLAQVMMNERSLSRRQIRDKMMRVAKGGAMYNQQRGKDYLMSKFVNTPEQHLQRHYLDGLQDSVQASTNDEMSVAGTSTDSHPMKFFCTISKSKDDSNPELNVNLMLLGSEDGAVEEYDGDEARAESPSCMSESTQMTQGTRGSVEDVYLNYSRTELTDTMLMSLAENEVHVGGDGGGESPFNTDDLRGEEKLNQFLDNILRRHGLLSASLATVSVPVFPYTTSEED